MIKVNSGGCHVIEPSSMKYQWWLWLEWIQIEMKVSRRSRCVWTPIWTERRAISQQVATLSIPTPSRRRRRASAARKYREFSTSAAKKPSMTTITTSAWRMLIRPTLLSTASTAARNLEAIRSSKMSSSRIYSAPFRPASIGRRGTSSKLEAPPSIIPDSGSKTFKYSLIIDYWDNNNNNNNNNNINNHYHYYH